MTDDKPPSVLSSVVSMTKETNISVKDMYSEIVKINKSLDELQAKLNNQMGQLFKELYAVSRKTENIDDPTPTLIIPRTPPVKLGRPKKV